MYNGTYRRETGGSMKEQDYGFRSTETMYEGAGYAIDDVRPWAIHQAVEGFGGA